MLPSLRTYVSGIDTIHELKTFGQAGNSYNDLIKNLIAEHTVAIIK